MVTRFHFTIPESVLFDLSRWLWDKSGPQEAENSPSQALYRPQWGLGYRGSHWMGLPAGYHQVLHHAPGNKFTAPTYTLTPARGFLGYLAKFRPLFKLWHVAGGRPLLAWATATLTFSQSLNRPTFSPVWPVPSAWNTMLGGQFLLCSGQMSPLLAVQLSYFWLQQLAIYYSSWPFVSSALRQCVMICFMFACLLAISSAACLQGPCLFYSPAPIGSLNGTQ